MIFLNNFKTLIISTISLYTRTNARFKCWKNRTYTKIVQFFSIRKKTAKEIIKRYALTAEQKHEIDDFYEKNYGKKISYRWHNYFAGHNDTLVKEYIPMSMYWSEIESYMNPYPEYIRVFQNKSVISLIAKSIGIKTPRMLVACTDGQFLDENYDRLTLDEAVEKLSETRDIFIKPSIDSCSGRGCSMHHISQGVDSVTKESIRDILLNSGKNFLVQNVLTNHESIRKIYDKSLNTFRIITFQLGGNIYNCPVIMRIGRHGSTVDNACAGGVYIAVDNDGKLHKYAHSTKGEKISQHPDSGVIFENYSILPITGAIDSALKMHRALPMLGIVNWDFAIDANGDPVLIEANIRGGGMWMIQIAHGVGLFGNKTAQVLQWLKTIKSAPAADRSKYFCGKLSY